MSNANRIANILDALASDRFANGVTFLALCDWLGRPYFFERNMTALLAEGKIEAIEIRGNGNTRTEYRLAR